MKRQTIVIVTVLLLAISGIGIYVRQLWRERAVSAPVTQTEAVAPTFESFVGKQVCLECHLSEATAHAGSGHARTFHSASDFPDAMRLAGKTFDDTERRRTFKYDASSQEGLFVWIPGLFHDDAFPLPYILGSNTHAATFLTLLPMPGGETGSIEHRVSLFGDKLGLTPSHRDAVMHDEVEAFGVSKDAVTTRACVGCHATYFEIANHQLHHLIGNVDCEACHGPGRSHVQNMRNSKAEKAIHALKVTDHQSAVAQIENCGRCHRLPADVASGEVRPENWKLVRFQPVGMLQSKCVTKSTEAFSCTTCHDPHASPESSLVRSEAACMKCHSPSQAANGQCPVSPAANCLECHMPKVEIHPGIFFRDHWIRIRELAGKEADVQVPGGKKSTPRDSNL